MRKILFGLLITLIISGCGSVAGLVAGHQVAGLIGDVAVGSAFKAINNSLYAEDVGFSEINFEKLKSENNYKGIVEITGKLVYKPPTVGSIRFRDLSRSALVVSLLDNNDDFIGYGAGLITVKNGDVTSLERDKLYEFVVKAEIPKNQWDVLVNIKLEKLDIK